MVGKNCCTVVPERADGAGSSLHPPGRALPGKGKGSAPASVNNKNCSELQRDVVYFGWLIAPSSSSPPIAGGGEGGCAGYRQWVQLCTWSPNKLWISNLWIIVTVGNATIYSNVPFQNIVSGEVGIDTGNFIFISMEKQSPLPPFSVSV